MCLKSIYIFTVVKETTGTSSSCKTETQLINNFPFPPDPISWQPLLYFPFLNFGRAGSWCSTWAFSLVAARTLFLLQSTGSRVRGLSRCSPRAWLPCIMWDLCFPTRDRSRVSSTGMCIPNQWTTREVSITLLAIRLNYITLGCWHEWNHTVLVFLFLAYFT